MPPQNRFNFNCNRKSAHKGDTRCFNGDSFEEDMGGVIPIELRDLTPSWQLFCFEKQKFHKRWSSPSAPCRCCLQQNPIFALPSHSDEISAVIHSVVPFCVQNWAFVTLITLSTWQNTMSKQITWLLELWRRTANIIYSSVKATDIALTCLTVQWQFPDTGDTGWSNRFVPCSTGSGSCVCSFWRLIWVSFVEVMPYMARDKNTMCFFVFHCDQRVVAIKTRQVL